MAHLYRALVSLRTLILAGTLILAAVGGFVAQGSSLAQRPAASLAGVNSTLASHRYAVDSRPVLCTPGPPSYSALPCPPAASLVPAAAAASCAGSFVTTLPETYLVTHWGTTSAACATAAAQVYAATLPQTNFLHYLPYTSRLQHWG